jgi:hypothetical protein
MADASAQGARRRTDDAFLKALRALITRNGEELVDFDELRK